MNLRQLHAIQIVAELGSVTAAAARLGLTQSAISRSVAALEAELGLKLFERYRRRLIPTQNALQFVERAGHIVSSMHEFQASARATKQGKTDRLRVISVPPFLESVLPCAIAGRLRLNPRLSFKVVAARRVDVPDWISRRDFDVAVVGLPVDRPEVVVNSLPLVEAVAVLPRNHRLTKQKRVRLEDILAGPLIAHSTGTLLRYEFDRVLARRGSAPAPVVEASNGWVVCAMVAAGAGVAIVDPFTATARANSSLIVRPLKEKVTLSYGILTFRERPLAAETATFVKDIQSEVSKSIKAIHFN